MVIWLFNLLALGDQNKFLKFTASIPRDRAIDLMIPPTIESRKNLVEPLTILLRSSATGTGATGPDEDVRKRSLLICLDAIYHIAQSPIILDLSFVQDLRVNFANIALMRPLWRDSDSAVRIISRSICALIAKKMLNVDRFLEQELHWLQEVTGETSNSISNADYATLIRMNVTSFVYGVLLYQVNPLSPEDEMRFKKTLTILLGEPSRVFSMIILGDPSEEPRPGYLDARDPQSRQVIDMLHSVSSLSPTPSRFL